MKGIISLKDLSIHSKKVLMRVDFNVCQDEKGQITDDTRIKAALPSIRWVLEHGGALILMSHLGRPKEKLPKFSLSPVAERLSALLGKKVVLASDCGGEDSLRLSKVLKPGEVLLLENLRFNPAEEKPEKDPSFAKSLANLGDVYVDDAFGAAHRAHSSITEVPKYFGAQKGAGLLLAKEVEWLEKTLTNPGRPFLALVGGAKISSKLGVLKALSEKADEVLIGGAMAFTLLKARGFSVGDSLVEEDTALPTSKNLILPLDFVCEKGGEIKIFSHEIPAGWKGMDIGPTTLKLFDEKIAKAKTVLWNGPMGVFEDPRFAAGTREVAQAIVRSGAVSIVGGGDSIFAIQQAGLEDKFTHVSTGGGATLEYIEYGKLPGIEALRQQD